MYFQEALAQTEQRSFPGPVGDPYHLRLRDLNPTLPSSLNYVLRVNRDEKALGKERTNRDNVRLYTTCCALVGYDVLCLPISASTFALRLCAGMANEMMINPSRERRRVKTERGLQLT